jgi:hypothetical protein
MSDLIPGVHFSDSELQIIGSLASAIVGALIAFGLVMIRDRFKGIGSRKRLHYRTLVKLNRQLNLHSGRMIENICLLPRCAESLRNGEVYFNKLRPINFNLDILIDLHNLRLENALYTYFDAVSKDNDDIENMQNSLEMLANGFMNGNLSQESYQENVAYLADKLDVLQKRIETGSLRANAAALASINDLIKRDLTIGMKIDQILVGQKKFDISKLEVEGEQVYARYKKDIAKINKGYEKEDDADKSRKKTKSGAA